MAVTLRRIVLAARIALPIAIAGDAAAAAPALAGPVADAARFALAYATALLMMIAFRRRGLGTILLAAAALLTVIWSLRTPGDDVIGLGAAIAGAACGIVPAWLRDLARIPRGDDRVPLADLRRRRRAIPLLPDRNGGRRWDVDAG